MKKRLLFFVLLYFGHSAANVFDLQQLALNPNPSYMTKVNMLALGGATGFVAGALGTLLRDNSDSLVGRAEFIFLGTKVFGICHHSHQLGFKVDQASTKLFNQSGPIFAYIAASAVGRVAGRVCARVLRKLVNLKPSGGAEGDSL